MWQLGSLTLNDDLKVATELIIGNLNENGYLTASEEELAEALIDALGSPEATAANRLALVEQARSVIAKLDPAGIGARDLRECLLWQLEAIRNELAETETRH